MREIIYDAAVIGAGASGLMAAVTAARLGVKMVLLEHMDQAAKKILSTGNGKCNYTNADQSLENYYCEDPDFVRSVLEKFSYADTVRFFEELGIRPLQKNGTCIYPENEQAVSIRNVLLAEAERLRIPLVLSVGIRRIHKCKNININGSYQKDIFQIETKDRAIYCRTCVLATGGKSAKKTGSDGSGYIYAEQLGHTVKKPLPALTALLAGNSKWKLPAGIRTGCAAALYVDGERKACEKGELQMTDYGISGIVIFQFCRIAARALEENREVTILLDFKPDLSETELAGYLTERFSSVYQAGKTIDGGLTGFLPDKLIPVIRARAGLAAGQLCKNCSGKQAAGLAAQLKRFEVLITGTRDFNFAQVSTGGVLVQEIYAENMESRIVPGLFFAGELMDVDAKCGGYNLQWAWSSGYVAGKSIFERTQARNSRKKKYADGIGQEPGHPSERSVQKGYDSDSADQSTGQTRRKRY